MPLLLMYRHGPVCLRRARGAQLTRLRALVQHGRLPVVDEQTGDSPRGLAGLTQHLLATGRKRRHELVLWQGFERIDATEVARGQAAGKPREKIVSIPELLAVGGGLANAS